MNTWSYFLIRFVHIFAMAVWTGGPIIAGIALSRLRTLEQPGTRAIAPMMHAFTKVFVVSAVTTLVSGGLLAYLPGGAVPIRIYIALVLSLLLFAIGGTTIRPITMAIGRHFEEGRPTNEAAPLLARFFRFHRLELVIRLVILALMVFKF